MKRQCRNAGSCKQSIKYSFCKMMGVNNMITNAYLVNNNKF